MAAPHPVSIPTPDPRLGSREILQNYLDDIYDTPVLETTEQNELFLGMEEAEAGLRAALAQIPALASALVARWHDRQAHGRVTGALSRYHRDGKVTDADERIDKALSKVEKLIGRLESATSAARPKLRRELAPAVEAAEIALPVLFEIQDELERGPVDPARTSTDAGRRSPGAGGRE